MSECKHLATCSFFKEYKENEKLKLALVGFVSLYCKGDKVNECKRKEISETLNGAEHVPANMMPNGFPLSGTDSSDWTEEVKKIAGVL